MRVQSREPGDNISLRKVELLWHNSLAQCGTVLTEVPNDDDELMLNVLRCHLTY